MACSSASGAASDFEPDWDEPEKAPSIKERASGLAGKPLGGVAWLGLGLAGRAGGARGERSKSSSSRENKIVLSSFSSEKGQVNSGTTGYFYGRELIDGHTKWGPRAGAMPPRAWAVCGMLPRANRSMIERWTWRAAQTSARLHSRTDVLLESAR